METDSYNSKKIPKESSNKPYSVILFSIIFLFLYLPSHRHQSWIFIVKIYVEPEAPILWPTDSKSWLIKIDLMLGKTEKRRRGQQRMRWLDDIINSMDMNLGKLGDGEGQGSLACCSPWGRKELDTAWQLNKKRLPFMRHQTAALCLIFSTNVFVLCWRCYMAQF